MTPMRSLPFLAAAAALLSSCQSMSEGFLSLEARAIVLEDTELDAVDAATSFDEEDIDVTGFGLHAAVGTPIVDVLAGIDRREYADEETEELSLGVRRRILDLWLLHPYIEANLRYALDLDNGVNTDDELGYSAGLGTTVELNDSFHLNLRLMYETLDVELTTGSTDADGLVGTVGLIYVF